MVHEGISSPVSLPLTGPYPKPRLSYIPPPPPPPRNCSYPQLPSPPLPSPLALQDLFSLFKNLSKIVFPESLAFVTAQLQRVTAAAAPVSFQVGAGCVCGGKGLALMMAQLRGEASTFQPTLPCLVLWLRIR